MSPTPSRRRSGVLVILAVTLVAILGVAIWGLIDSRREAREIAVADLALRTTAQARTVESALATLRGDLLFLAQSPTITRAAEMLIDDDPFRQRQGRLDVEGTLYLFAESHAAIERLVLLGRDGTELLGIGRRQDRPVFLGADDLENLENDDALAATVRSVWPLGRRVGAGTLLAWIAPVRLLDTAVPAGNATLTLTTEPLATPTAERAAGIVTVRQPVERADWTPPIHWTLARRENESELLGSYDVLARRFRTTLLLDFVLLSGAFGLAVFAYRHARRADRAEAENRHQERVRELERQVQHADRLASVGRLAAGIAHEINNPLEGMANYLALLRDDLREGRAEEAEPLVDRVQEGLDRTAGIVRQVLSFADPGRSPREPVDLADVLDRTVSFVRRNPEFRHLELALETSRPLALEGNSTTLGQLFLNLVLNACHAQPESGRVDVRAALENGGALAIVSVEDRGPGLTDEVKRRLFEPFHSTRGSTGLGLAICHGIVEDHGGTIRGENRADGGARFTVELPLGGTK
ncbi:MAG: ATP-binding protein [bacterium]